MWGRPIPDSLKKGEGVRVEKNRDSLKKVNKDESLEISRLSYYQKILTAPRGGGTRGYRTGATDFPDLKAASSKNGSLSTKEIDNHGSTKGFFGPSTTRQVADVGLHGPRAP